MARLVVSVIGALLLGCLAYGSSCPEQQPATRHVLCYYEGRTHLNSLNLCNCTHIVLTNVAKVDTNFTLDLIEGGKKNLDEIIERKQSLLRIFTLSDLQPNVFISETKSLQLINGITNFIGQHDFNGVELDFSYDPYYMVSKDSITSFLKALKKNLNDSPHLRVKRAGYDVSENVEDDITTAPYRTPTARSSRSNEKSQTTKKPVSKRRKSSYRVTRVEETATDHKVLRTERRSRRMRKELRDDGGYKQNSLVLVRLPNHPEVIGKKFDLKSMSKYADLLVMSTHNITDESETRLTYHPSRLMGLSDMLNADSILDFLTGLGVAKSKVILSLPATILKFQLEDSNETTPRSPRTGELQLIKQSELCSLFSVGNWTVERDDDLTAPYAFSGTTWLAYEDKTSVNIKAKYILLRELAGGAIYPIDSDNANDPCNETSSEVGSLTNTLYRNIMNLDRKPRGLVLESLQQDIHDITYSNIEAGLHQSEYRIVRVVDHSGAVHVIRRNTKTQFECSRQGYFSHPLGCNKFYRCVKFNQYIDDFTVFEYDCPAGLAFDERWEVCVWPGSLPHGAPCTGSSEIAPVPRSHYQCPNHEGYYADPENCRWFFACLDHARDGVTPLTAYEFRCPFGLVFNELNLACDWPWNVGTCGNRGFSGVIVEHHGGSSASLGAATFAHQGEYEENFAQSYQGGFGSSAGLDSGAFVVSKQSGFAAASAGSQAEVSSHQNSGSGYISGHFEDNQNKASFATLPDYEISGGRILSRGGLILDHIVNAGHSSITNSGFNTFGSQVQSGHASIGEHVSISTAVPVTQTVTPKPAVPRLSQFVYNPPLSTPRPFSVQIPEVQINQEPLDSSYVHVSSTPRVDSHFLAGGSNSFESFNSLTSSSASAEYTHNDANFGQKINVDHSGNLKSFGIGKDVELQVSTPVPTVQLHAQNVHSVSNGYDQSSKLSVTTAGYEHNGDTSEFASNTFKFSSTTPKPSILLQHNNVGFGDASVYVTPQVEIKSFQEPEIHHKSSLQTFHSAAVGGIVSNGTETLIQRPLVEVSTAAPYVLGASTTASSLSGGFQDLGFGLKSGGNAILLEEHIERVVIPKVLPSSAPTVSYQHPGVSVKSVVDSVKAPIYGATVTHAPVTIERQEFIGPITHRKEIIQPHVVSTPAPAIYRQTDYVRPAILHQSVNHQYKQSHFVRPVEPTLATGVFSKTEHVSGNRDISVLKDSRLIQSVQSIPFSGVYKAEENPAFVQGETIGQVNKYIFPEVHTKVAQSVTAKSNIADEGSGYAQIHQVQTPAVHEVKLTQSIQPAVFKASEYLPPVQTLNVNHYHHGLAQSTPAPVKTSFVVSGVKQLKPVIQEASTPAPDVYRAPEYLPPVNTGAEIQTNEKFRPIPVGQTYVKPAISTPSPTVFTKTEQAVGVRVEQAHLDLSSAIQHNTQTLQVSPEVKVIQPVVSTPAPTVFTSSANVFESFGNRGQTFIKHAQSPAVSSVKLTQPVSSTPAPAVYKAPEYLPPVPSFGVVNQVRTSVEKNFVAPVVTSPKPIESISVLNTGVIEEGHVVNSVSQISPEISVYNRPSYLPPSTSSPIVEEVKISQPIFSTEIPNSVSIQQYDKIDHQQQQSPHRSEHYNFLSSTTISPIDYKEKYISESVSASPRKYVQGLFHTSPQLVQTVDQPEALVTYEQPLKSEITFNKLVTTDELKSPSPAPAQIFGYQSTLSPPLLKAGISSPKSHLIETVTAKPLLVQSVSQEKLSVPVAVTQKSIEQDISTSKPYVYEEYVEISSPKPSESPRIIEHPIVVADRPKSIIQQVLLQSALDKPKPKTVYYENFERTNPVLSALTKEVVQPVIQQEVSSESPIVVHNAADHFAYYPPTSQEIETYSNFDFQKVGKARGGFSVQNTDFYNAGIQENSNQQEIKYDSKSVISQQPQEYLVDVTPQLVTTTSAPLETTSIYRSSARPATTTAAYEEEHYVKGYERGKATVISVGEVDKEEIDEENVESLLQKYSSEFGNVLGRNKFTTKVVEGEERGEFIVNDDKGSTVGYDISTESHSKLKSGYNEENGGTTSLDLKNLKLKKNKKTVIVVTQVSDTNPLLIGKLAGQCSCQSNKLQVRKKVARVKTRTTTSTTFAPPSDESSSPNDLDSLAVEAVTPESSTENIVLIDGSRSSGKSSPRKILFKPEGLRKRRPIAKSKSNHDEISGNEIGQALFSPVPAADIADTQEKTNAITAGAAFDRYGPGGLRGFDETLQGSVDCERPGLFRHPKYCNKFYACNYDPWKKRYTLHVFNCPIHLSYDSSISACNWPSKGPACSDDHLLI